MESWKEKRDKENWQEDLDQDFEYFLENDEISIEEEGFLRGYEDEEDFLEEEE